MGKVIDFHSEVKRRKAEEERREKIRLQLLEEVVDTLESDFCFDFRENLKKLSINVTALGELTKDEGLQNVDIIFSRKVEPAKVKKVLPSNGYLKENITELMDEERLVTIQYLGPNEYQWEILVNSMAEFYIKDGYSTGFTHSQGGQEVIDELAILLSDRLGITFLD
ncbi:MAG: hypothetical protein COB67_05185 [SAR324 cluster bacterium]|uniref:Uncharacterized protein n=1 Tax=SAR324 cluster bacterium TaxID=2024889 RepID=A0A2A4T6R5_9DELT|nr:MAG: hypothetical protein COB67_05185 [SAR324 cluster bacterium]